MLTTLLSKEWSEVIALLFLLAEHYLICDIGTEVH